MAVKNTIIGQPITREKMERAKQLRRQMTPAEKALWARIHGNRLGGFHFRRQQVIDGFSVDFYCHACALVVEIDGDVHELQKESDARREAHLRLRGFQVVRFRNEEILYRLDRICEKLLDMCESLRHPLPASGRGAGD
jgi:very-short-patch-repair endonuclease